MTKLNLLIAEMCPNGVEYKSLGEVCLPTSNINWSKTSGEYSYIDLTSVDRETQKINEATSVTADNAPSRAQKIISVEDVIFATTRPTLNRYCFVPIEYSGQICSTGFCVLRANTNVILPKFIYHTIGSTSFRNYVEANQRGSAYPAISDVDVKKFVFSLPPLPIQSEIVRILDNFTELSVELTTELTAELKARKKQYEYYRNELLTFGDDVPMVSLGEIATEMYRGAGIKRDEITESGTPCVRYGEIYTVYNIWFDTCISRTHTGTKTFGHGDVLFAITGESVEGIAKSSVYMGNEKCFAGGDIVVMKHDQNPKYISYALSTANAQRQKSRGRVKSKVVHTSIPALKEIVIPVPPLEKQERIVAILDRFDALTTDIATSLPAEIEARRKQYEYYRDKLLTLQIKQNPANKTTHS